MKEPDQLQYMYRSNSLKRIGGIKSTFLKKQDWYKKENAQIFKMKKFDHF